MRDSCLLTPSGPPFSGALYIVARIKTSKLQIPVKLHAAAAGIDNGHKVGGHVEQYCWCEKEG